MSEYYKIPRHKDWNYIPGVKNRFKLSRTKIDLFMNCPRCFYMDNRLGLKRPPGYPFNLNTAVDTLLKKEFDIYREKGEPHPLIKKYKVDAIPIHHEDLNKWRENFVGIQYHHEPTNLTITGAIDDLWQNRKNEYIVVDYKATSKNEKIEALDQGWHDGYKRQMEIYQWLLRQKGFNVSDTGYFVYCNGDTAQEVFDARLEFDLTLISYTGNSDLVEKTINDAHKCLNSSEIPEARKDCDYCAYISAVQSVKSANPSINNS
jgi:CRISPR/Cas system-associated exonuclease Cas4 (RecB family)